jgi:FkbM family methyltransferase
MIILRIQKLIYCLLRPKLWRRLALGIAPTIEHRRALRRFQFQSVVDIGANRGQFASFARETFPGCQLYCFEPLKRATVRFRKAFEFDQFTELFPFGIGQVRKRTTLNVATRDDSSSLLAPADLQQSIFGASLKSHEVVEVRPLDDCLTAGMLRKPALLKIDVQGSELDVLRGCDSLLNSFDAIYVECSYLELYRSQPLAVDVIGWLDTHDFAIAGVYNQWDDEFHGPVQADFLFVRKSMPAHVTEFTS